MSHDLLFASATSLRKKLLAKEISSTELVQTHLEHIEAINPQLNAIEKIITQALRSMPRHEEFIAKQCAARRFAYK